MRRAAAASLAVAACVTLAACLTLAACHRKHGTAASADVTGLGAVPASAQVVVSADVARVIDAPLVRRVADELLARDPSLAASWQKLHASCKLDPKSVQHVTLAIGPHEGAKPGTGPVLIIASGTLSEAAFADCVRAMVGQGGGAVTTEKLGARTLYEAKDGNRVMYFAFGRADTVVMSASKAFVTEALGGGKKLADNPDMSGWVKLADQQAPLWAAGRVDPRVSQGLPRATDGKLSAGPTAFVASLDLPAGPSAGATAGVKLEIDAVMASPADAKTLESFAKTELGTFGMIAQARSLGTIVDKVSIAADGTMLRCKAALDQDEVNQLISALDGAGGSAQDAAPTGSGSSAGSQTGSQGSN